MLIGGSKISFLGNFKLVKCPSTHTHTRSMNDLEKMICKFIGRICTDIMKFNRVDVFINIFC